jgi:hypothetical protein
VWTFITMRRVFGAPFFWGWKLATLEWSSFSEGESGQRSNIPWGSLIFPLGTEPQLTGVRELTDTASHGPKLPSGPRLDSKATTAE